MSRVEVRDWCSGCDGNHGRYYDEAGFWYWCASCYGRPSGEVTAGATTPWAWARLPGLQVWDSSDLPIYFGRSRYGPYRTLSWERDSNAGTGIWLEVRRIDHEEPAS